MEVGILEYKTAEEFLTDIRKEFEERDKEVTKVVKLRRLEQREKTIEEFVQEFKRVARRSRYEERPLVKEFKRGMNGVIRRKLMKVERPSLSIKQ